MDRLFPKKHYLLYLIIWVASLMSSMGQAHADEAIKAEIEQKITEGMAAYDLLDYEKAEELLLEAASLGVSNSMDDPVVAEAFLDLGILYFSAADDEVRAKQAIDKAVEMNPTIEIPLDYRTPELQALIERARADVSGAADGGSDTKKSDADEKDSEEDEEDEEEEEEEESEEEDPCENEELTHELIDSIETGDDIVFDAYISEKAKAKKIKAYYRFEDDEDFKLRILKKKEGCLYRGKVSAKSIKGELIYYYIVAVSEDGDEISTKGTEQSPNIVDVEDLDEDDPIGGEEEDKHPKVLLGLSFGLGLGVVSGNTEVQGSEIACCIAPEWIHFVPEIGYFITPKTSISASFRAGLPIGANITGHATFAPSGYLKLRHSSKAGGRGLTFSGLLGGGVIRHVVSLRNPPSSNMNNDTAAMGPFLLGAAVGYIAKLGGAVSLVMEVAALGALTLGLDELGDCTSGTCTRLNNGIDFDFNVGVQLGF